MDKRCSKAPMELIGAFKEPSDREVLEAQFDNCTFLRDAIVDNLRGKLDALVMQAEANNLYSDPAWPYKQADLLGQRKGIRAALTLLEGNKVVS